MKILHCISRLSGGGAERQLAYLSHQQTRMGHEVLVAFVEDGPDPTVHSTTEVASVRLRTSGNHDPRLFIQLITLMRRVKPDIVTTWVLQMDVLAGVASTMLSIPWVLREPSSAKAWPRNFKNGLRTFVGRRAAAVVSNSRGGDHYWSERIPPQSRFVIPNALPLQQIRDAKAASIDHLDIPSSAPIVLYAGRLCDKEKNMINMITAFSALPNAFGAVLLICGEGADRNAMEDHVRKVKCGHRIFFLGHVSDIWSWMKRATLVVNVSYLEGQPNAVLEAMACGCPLVVSDIPAHREILDESSAILVDPTDASMIGSALATVLQNRPNAERRAEAASRAVESYSVERTAKEYLHVYKHLLTTRSDAGNRFA